MGSSGLPLLECAWPDPEALIGRVSTVARARKISITVVFFFETSDFFHKLRRLYIHMRGIDTFCGDRLRNYIPNEGSGKKEKKLVSENEIRTVIDKPWLRHPRDVLPRELCPVGFGQTLDDGLGERRGAQSCSRRHRRMRGFQKPSSPAPVPAP